jgi:hypothetical protein
MGELAWSILAVLIVASAVAAWTLSGAIQRQWRQERGDEGLPLLTREHGVSRIWLRRHGHRLHWRKSLNSRRYSADQDTDAEPPVISGVDKPVAVTIFAGPDGRL